MYIDPHVHCRDGTQSYRETIKHALEVAKNAGVDAIFDMPNTDPPIVIREQVVERLRIADLCYSDVFYGLYVGITNDPEQIKEAVNIYNEFFPRVVGLKLFAGKSVGDLAIVDMNSQMNVYKILSEVGYKGVLVVHSEKESFFNLDLWDPENPISHCKSRPVISELCSIQDQIGFALRYGFKGKLHIAHVSCFDSVEYINLMKKNHPELNISCGVTPHHLFFTEEIMKEKNGMLFKVNPPLRAKKEQEKMLDYLKNGMIDYIETDHAPHIKIEKLGSPYMSGIPWLNQWPKLIEKLRENNFSEEIIENITFNNVKNIFGVDIEKRENSGKYFREYETEVCLDRGIKKININGKKVMPFTIPSGIVTTEVSSIRRVMKEIPEVGIITTKSICLDPRVGNREPILGQYAPSCFINAVGLTNVGAESFAKKLSELNVPEDKFLLVSIFGKTQEEIVSVAKILEPYADGFELNLSCPHVKGCGIQLGQDKEMVYNITRAVVESVTKPVFAKLSPNVPNVAEIAKAAIEGGAYGLVAINTVGPGFYSFDSEPVLTNKVGGLSGRGILPIGLKCVKEIREAVGSDVLIIGMGGISNSRDVEAYFNSGANAIGVGSTLIGMTEEEMKEYFSVLCSDFGTSENRAEGLLKKVDMEYKKVCIESVSGCSDFKIFKTNEKMKVLPGQFVFAWIPGVGEKPFSVMDDDPLTLGILERGEFTKKINFFKKGDSFYVRGAYGQGVDVSIGSSVVLVGGGCGIAGIYLLAKELSKKAKVLIFLAAKDKEHISYLEEFEKCGEVRVATEDGSVGVRGLITDLFNNFNIERGSYFFNCGPKAMIDAVLPMEEKYSLLENIYSSVDYMTKCGVGICGSCTDNKGKRTCVEGPFVS